MAKKADVPSGYVKKETTLVVAFIFLVVGFLIGIVFSAFKLGPGLPVQSSAPPQPPPPPTQTSQDQGVPIQQATRIPGLELETSSNPGNVEAWVQLGNAYYDTNQYEKAINAYKRSLDLDQNNADVWTDMGVMYRRKGQPAEAIKAFDKAIEVNPKHEKSRFNKGVVLLHDLGDREGAINTWEGLIGVNPFSIAPNGQPLIELVDTLKKGVNK